MDGNVTGRGEDSVDLVHHNRVRGARIRHVDSQHQDMHLQVVEETTGLSLPPRLSHGDIPRGWSGSDVYGSASRIGRC